MLDQVEVARRNTEPGGAAGGGGAGVGGGTVDLRLQKGWALPRPAKGRGPLETRSVREFGTSAELVHRVVCASGLQGCLAGEVFLVVVADVGSGHVLVPHAGDALSDLLPLHVEDIAQHRLRAEILPG